MEDILANLGDLWAQFTGFLLGLLVPIRLYQVLLLLALFSIAHLIARWARPRITDWMRGLEGMKAWQLRTMIVFNRRMRGILFSVLAGLVYAAMQTEFMRVNYGIWPSRSQIIAIVAMLAAGWTFVAIASRLIRNNTIRTLVRWSAWALITIWVLDKQDEVVSFLDLIGFSIGETRFSLLILLKGLVYLAGLVFAATWISNQAGKQLKGVEDISPSIRVLLEKIVRIVLYGIALVVGLQSLGFDLTSLTVFSGAVGLGIGFGLQKVFSNLLSGFILLMDKSIKPGDVISLGDTFGWITELNARFVAVITRDGKEYLIPNEDLITSQVVNWSHSSDLVRLDIHFGVSYKADPHEVRALAVEAAATVERVVAAPRPVCHITGFGESSIDFILRFWIRDPSGGLTNVRGNVFLALWDALKDAEVEIPYPHRDIVIHTAPEDSRTTGSAGAEKG